MVNDRPVSLEAIVFDLESDDESLRKGALLSVPDLGERALEAIPLLQEIATADPSIELRYIARKVLGLLATQASMEPAPTGPRQSAGLTQALVRVPPEVLALRLASSNPAERGSAYRATAMKRDAALLPSLLTRVGVKGEPDPDLRALLVQVIAVLGGKGQLRIITSYLDDPDPRVRCATVEMLARLQDLTACTHIARALQDGDQEVAVAAARALKAVGGLNILKIGAVMMRSDATWAREAGANMLGTAKIPEATPLLERALTDGHEPVRTKAQAGLKRLAELGHAEARAALERAASVRERGGVLAFEGVEKQPQAPKPANVADRRRFTRQVASLSLADENQLPSL